MVRNAGPVLASSIVGYAFSNILKFFPGLGSVAGGSANSYIGGASTLVLGSLATVYLKRIHLNHSKQTKSELENEINKYIQSEQFKTFMNNIKDLAKNPMKINRNDLISLLQKA